MIQLALAVIPTANQRANLTGVRIQRYQRNLHLRNGILVAFFCFIFFPFRVFLFEQQINIFRASFDSGDGGAL